VTVTSVYTCTYFIIFYTIIIVFLFCILSLSVNNHVLTKCVKFNILWAPPCMDLMNAK
jgi:hypothetical protein